MPAWVPSFIPEVERLFKPKSTGELLRPRYPREVAGVCSGIAEHFGWDANTLRILAAVSIPVSGGAMLLAYAAAWVIIPEGQYALPKDAGATKS